MTADYQSILQQQAIADFAERNEAKQYLIPLPGYGAIHVEGEDATTFLQSLLTNDVNQLAEQPAQLSAMCNPKGRLLALFFLIRHTDGYYLVLPKSQAAFLAQRLQMFKLRSKVTIEDISEACQVCGLQGNDFPDSSTILPSANHAVLIAPAEQLADELNSLLSEGWQLANENSWHISEIESGVPAIEPETREQFTAQQLNLDLIGGVSFRKGCYPGQEVVARLHYLGEPKRRLFQAVAQTQSMPQRGEAVVNQQNAVVGHLVRAVERPENGLLLQLSLKLESIEEEMYLSDGTALTEVRASAA